MQMPFLWPAAGLGGSTQSLLCSIATSSGELPRRLTAFGRRRYVFAEHGLSLQEYLVAPPHGYFDKDSAPFPNPKLSESLLYFLRQRKILILNCKQM